MRFPSLNRPFPSILLPPISLSAVSPSPLRRPPPLDLAGKYSTYAFLGSTSISEVKTPV